MLFAGDVLWAAKHLRIFDWLTGNYFAKKTAGQSALIIKAMPPGIQKLKLIDFWLNVISFTEELGQKVALII